MLYGSSDISSTQGRIRHRAARHSRRVGCARAPAKLELRRVAQTFDSYFPHGYVPPVTERTTVTLKAMQFHACVGVLPHEKELPQLIEIDISVTFISSGPAALQSGGAQVDYRDLYAIASESVGSGHTELLEHVAERITSRALVLPGVRSSRVAVRKPNVPMPGRLEYAEVVLERVSDE